MGLVTATKVGKGKIERLELEAGRRNDTSSSRSWLLALWLL